MNRTGEERRRKEEGKEEAWGVQVGVGHLLVGMQTHWPQFHSAKINLNHLRYDQISCIINLLLKTLGLISPCTINLGTVI